MRGEADDRELLVVISSLDKIVKRFLAANEEAVKIEELKADIVANRTTNIVKEAGELMEVAVAGAQKSMTGLQGGSCGESSRRPTRSAWQWRSWW